MFRFTRIVAVALALAIGAFAQINSGMITGVVTDPQKAVIPHAKVEVVEDATHYTYSATTNSNGEYTVPYLKAGAYSVRSPRWGSRVPAEWSQRRHGRHGARRY